MRKAALTAAAVVMAALVVLGARDLLAVRSNLVSVRTHLASAADAAGSFDVATLREITSRASVPAARAHDASRSLVLRGVSAVPLLGNTVRSVRAVAEAAEAAVDGAAGLIAAADAFPVSGGRLDYGLTDGALELKPWEAVGPAAERAVTAVARAKQALASAPDTFVLPRVAQAQEQAGSYLTRLDSVAHAFRAGAELLPPMLGSTEPRRYLIVLQNLAEQRATGGIPGGTVIIEANAGRLELRDVASNLYIVEAEEDVPQPAWFRRRYDRYAARRLWVNANAEPHLPVTAPLLADLYRSIVGSRVDGVIMLDPIALEAFMSVTGPVQDPLDGSSVAAADIAPLVMSDAYVRFPAPHGNLARKRYFEALAGTIWEAFSRSADLPSAAAALSAAADGKHLQMWSSRPAEQRVIERVGLGGVVGTMPSEPPGYAFITQSASANKMDYYLRRRSSIEITRRRGGLVRVRSTMELHNTGPSSGLPEYVLGPEKDVETYRPGFIRTYFSAYLPPDAFVHGIQVDGKRSVHESELAPHALIVSDFLTVYPGQRRKVVVDWSIRPDRPWSPLEIRIQKQPTVVPDETSIRYAERPGEVPLVLVPPGSADGDLKVQIPGRGLLRRLFSLLTSG